MSKNDLRQKWIKLIDSGTSESLEGRVLRIFFCQPSIVGSPSAGGSRHLDLTREDDRAMFRRAVQEDFNYLLNNLSFIDKPKAEEFFQTFLAQI